MHARALRLSGRGWQGVQGVQGVWRVHVLGTLKDRDALRVCPRDGAVARGDDSGIRARGSGSRASLLDGRLENQDFNFDLKPADLWPSVAAEAARVKRLVGAG